LIPEKVFDFAGQCGSRGQIEAADQRFADIVGIPVEELIGVIALDLIYPDDKHHVLQAWESSCVDPGPFTLFRCRFLHHGEPTDWYEVIGRNCLDIETQSAFYLMGARQSTHQPLDVARDRSAAILEILIDTIPTLVYVQNVQTERLTFVNSRSTDVLGVVADQLRHIPAGILYSFIHRDDFIPADVYFQTMAKLPHRGVFEHRARVRHADGSFRWIRFRDAVLTRDEVGNPLRILGTMEDIHDQTLQQLSLAGSERRYRKLIENAYGGTTLINGEGIIEFESPANLDLRGTDIAAGHVPVWEMVHTDDLNTATAAWTQLLKEPGFTIKDLCIRAYSHDGRLCWYEISAVNLLDDPDVRSIVVNWHEVTKRKQAELAVRQSEERLKLTQQISGIGGWEWNVLTGDVWWSVQTCAIFGVDPDQFKPSEKSFFDMVLPDDWLHVQTCLGTAMKTGEGSKFQYRICRPDGSIRWLEDIYLTEQDAQGNLVFVRGSVRDITDDIRAAEERSRFEESVREIQRLESLGVLAGGIAHDFNNLLTVILASTDMASADPVNVPLHLDRTRTATLRAAELCRQLLAYAGRAKREIKPVDLNAIVNEMTVLLQATVSKRATLSIDAATKPLWVDGDSGQMVQIILNLITNASESLGERVGEISVRTQYERNSAPPGLFHYPPGPIPRGPMGVIEVKDNGSGIHPTELSRIFDPFFTTKSSGRGLGLAAVAGIVRSHQGVITVDSEIGAGTVFRIYLPVRSSPPTPIRSEVASSVSVSPRTILVVDDQPDVRQVLSAVFEANGYEVVTAATGEEALQLYDDQRIDAVLVDLSMPGRGGLETLADLRLKTPTLPVVVMSGFPEEEIAQKSSDMRFGILQKPFTPAEVIEKIVREIENSSNRNE
jgi:PAS domain S-box-containing protein